MASGRTTKELNTERAFGPKPHDAAELAAIGFDKSERMSAETTSEVLRTVIRQSCTLSIQSLAVTTRSLSV